MCEVVRRGVIAKATLVIFRLAGIGIDGEQVFGRHALQQLHYAVRAVHTVNANHLRFELTQFPERILEEQPRRNPTLWSAGERTDRKAFTELVLSLERDR